MVHFALVETYPKQDSRECIRLWLDIGGKSEYDLFVICCENGRPLDRQFELVCKGKYG